MNAAPVDDVDHNEHFTAHVLQSLREDFRLRADEARLAFDRYLQRQTRRATPDEAAYDAYRWWTPTVEPSVVLAREAEQRAHAQSAGDQVPDRAEPGPVESVPVGDDADVTRADAVETDLAAAEAALSLIRGQGQRRGFTGEHVELAGHVKQVLDESAVWDTITPDDQPDPAGLEPALRPETVRPGDDWDDIIALDASFAGRTVTVLRPPGQIGPFSYVFLADTPGTRFTKQGADTGTLGMIAAGDGEPDPARSAEYDDLGQQVRRHLIGLVDAVAEAREQGQEQEGRRLHAAQTGLGGVAEAAYQRPQPARGTSR
ncbi:hypothetical protein [Nakamurella multipartita]|uniref:Uncharacterized protein n=1 Tax=Nakamurella multipartita (strain ATCC 700099 / DSM 44233 / CIP 104796 / JCM 9543 / NBRC 105858 / Y-104) TaxID=479431 RepID=C8X707_NAKMY|nr:hypothetical protein [Nakamurella multipartita]ACV76876.1 hypothetical protein Namu_0456 [Nakamurella multipartita DSM 44233]